MSPSFTPSVSLYPSTSVYPSSSPSASLPCPPEATADHFVWRNTNGVNWFDTYYNCKCSGDLNSYFTM
eukprot:10369583-Ditylum_brightwellii.AAC.1